MHDGHKGIRQLSAIIIPSTVNAKVSQKLGFMIGTEYFPVFFLPWGYWVICLHFINIFITTFIIESRSKFEMFRKYSQHNENPIVYHQHGNYIRIPHANPNLSYSVDRQHDKPAFSGLKQDLSHMLKSIENKKIIKGHYRNLSDTIQASDENCNRVQQVTLINGKSEEIRAMQQKILKMQERIIRVENKIQHFGFDKYLEETIIGDVIKESENKINILTMNIAELKEKLQNINLRLSLDPKLQFHNTCQNIKTDCQNLQRPNQKIEHYEGIIDQVKKQLNHKICELNDKLKSIASNRDFEQAINPQNHFFRTNRKYSGNYISFIYEQYIRRQEKEGEKQTKQMESTSRQCINQITYYIDWQGFLLDENCHYLVNSQMKQIKLSEKQLKMLKKNKILQG